MEHDDLVLLAGLGHGPLEGGLRLRPTGQPDDVPSHEDTVGGAGADVGILKPTAAPPPGRPDADTDPP